MMQPLPKGITGFSAPAEGVTIERFKAACYAAARRVKGNVLSVRATAHNSYHEARMTIMLSRDVINVLCNAQYPVVAFTAPHDERENTRITQHQFIDCPELALFAEEFTVITAAEACAPLTDEMIVQLDEDEKKQIRYWRPQQVGDVVFNSWD